MNNPHNPSLRVSVTVKWSLVNSIRVASNTSLSTIIYFAINLLTILCLNAELLTISFKSLEGSSFRQLENQPCTPTNFDYHRLRDKNINSLEKPQPRTSIDATKFLWFLIYRAYIKKGNMGNLSNWITGKWKTNNQRKLRKRNLIGEGYKHLSVWKSKEC